MALAEVDHYTTFASPTELMKTPTPQSLRFWFLGIVGPPGKWWTIVCDRGGRSRRGGMSTPVRITGDTLACRSPY